MNTRTATLVQTAFFVFGLIAVDVSAQDITIKPLLRAGDEFRLEVTRIQANTARTQQDGRSRTVVDVRAISVTPVGFMLDWAPGETVDEGPAGAQDPLTAITSQMLRGVVFRMALNADGRLTGVVNQAEMTTKIQAIQEAIVEKLAERLSGDERKSLQNVAAQVLSSESVISGATREAEIYFGLNGLLLVGGKPVQADIQQTNPFGGDAIPAKVQLDIESTTADSVSLKMSTTYDALALQRTTQSFLQQAAGPIPPEAFAKIPPMQMSNEGKYVFDRNLGLMREVIATRRGSFGNTRLEDRWEIKMVSAPGR